jgi:hypothetical protein
LNPLNPLFPLFPSPPLLTKLETNLPRATKNAILRREFPQNILSICRVPQKMHLCLLLRMKSRDRKGRDRKGKDRKGTRLGIISRIGLFEDLLVRD